MTKIVVLGSNSFSGSDFIDLMLDDPQNKIVGISRSPEKSALFLKFKKHPNVGNLITYPFDMNRYMESIITVIEDIKPEYIVNFAAQSEVAPSWSFPEQWIRTNIESLTTLITNIASKPWLKKYLHISSPEVYGTCNGNETLPYNPSTPYAVSKAAADMMLKAYHRKYNFPIVTVRSANVYGPHQQLHKIIPRAIIYMKLGKTLELHGGGAAVRSYVHIRDVSRAEKLVLEKGKIGEIYHIATRKTISIFQIVNLIAHMLGKDIKEVIKITGDREEQDYIYSLDCAKIRYELFWESEMSISDGILEVIKWIDDNWEEIQKQPLTYQHKV